MRKQSGLIDSFCLYGFNGCTPDKRWASEKRFERTTTGLVSQKDDRFHAIDYQSLSIDSPSLGNIARRQVSIEIDFDKVRTLPSAKATLSV